MPNCFQLTKKGETEPSKLVAIDEAMCAHFETEPDEIHYYANWYNTIGLGLAMGHPFEKIKEFFPEKKEVIDFLSENYTSNVWAEIGRRR